MNKESATRNPPLVWYLYDNDYNIGMARSQLKALTMLEYHAGRKIIKPQNVKMGPAGDVYSQNYIRIGKYEAKREDQK